MPIPSHLLTQTARIQRSVTTVVDGGVGQAWPSHIEGVAVRMRPLSSSEAVRAGRENTRGQWIAYTDRADLDIVATDRLQFTDSSGPVSRVRTLDINEVRNPHLMGHHLHIDCEETQ